jgi:hypothetical protein
MQNREIKYKKPTGGRGVLAIVAIIKTKDLFSAVRRMLR